MSKHPEDSLYARVNPDSRPTPSGFLGSRPAAHQHSGQQLCSSTGSQHLCSTHNTIYAKAKILAPSSLTSTEAEAEGVGGTSLDAGSGDAVPPPDGCTHPEADTAQVSSPPLR